jgi:mannose-6-phosphate isomerase-like protein (cupin superfamily)
VEEDRDAAYGKLVGAGRCVRMDAFVAKELLGRLDPGEHDYAEFFRSSTLSLSVARWPAGSVDDQEPHTEDEVYYVVEGRARLSVAGEEAAVGAGSVAFVAAGVEHRFREIEEGLEVVVFWAPPRHTNAPREG